MNVTNAVTKAQMIQSSMKMNAVDYFVSIVGMRKRKMSEIERKKARAKGKKKQEERIKKLNKHIIICLVLMYISFLLKDTHPYSWVMLIPTAIYCFFWSSANLEDNRWRGRSK